MKVKLSIQLFAVLHLSKDENLEKKIQINFLLQRTCTKRLIGNVPRLDDSSWPSTIVDSQVFKWSPSAVHWPVDFPKEKKNYLFGFFSNLDLSRTRLQSNS